MIWRGPIELVAKGLGVELDKIRGRLERQLTGRDIEVAFGTVPAGTVGAVRTIAAGIVDGREAIVVDHVIRMARDVAPTGRPRATTPPTSSTSKATPTSSAGSPSVPPRATTPARPR